MNTDELVGKSLTEHHAMVKDIQALKEKVKTIEKQRSYLVYGLAAIIIIKSFFDLIELS